jgi:hypothetical protein
MLTVCHLIRTISARYPSGLSLRVSVVSLAGRLARKVRPLRGDRRKQRAIHHMMRERSMIQV